MISGLFNSNLASEIQNSSVDDVNLLKSEEAEIKRLQKEAFAEQLNKIKEENEASLTRYKDEHKIRIGLINTLLIVTVIWIILILLVVIAVGKGHLKLSDGIIITLITTSTTQVLGFFYLVLRYLFNEKKST